MPPTQTTAHRMCSASTSPHTIMPMIHTVAARICATSERNSSAATDRADASVTPRPSANALAKAVRLPSAWPSIGSLRAAISASTASRRRDDCRHPVQHQQRHAALPLWPASACPQRPRYPAGWAAPAPTPGRRHAPPAWHRYRSAAGCRSDDVMRLTQFLEFRCRAASRRRRKMLTTQPRPTVPCAGRASA